VRSSATATLAALMHPAPAAGRQRAQQAGQAQVGTADFAAVAREARLPSSMGGMQHMQMNFHGLPSSFSRGLAAAGRPGGAAQAARAAQASMHTRSPALPCPLASQRTSGAPGRDGRLCSFDAQMRVCAASEGQLAGSRRHCAWLGVSLSLRGSGRRLAAAAHASLPPPPGCVCACMCGRSCWYCPPCCLHYAAQTSVFVCSFLCVGFTSFAGLGPSDRVTGGCGGGGRGARRRALTRTAALRD